MKNFVQKTIQQLLLSTGILFITCHTSLAYANSYSDTESGYFIKTGENSQTLQNNRLSSNQLPEGAILCDGKIVVVSKVIREQLSCNQNESLVTQWINHLLPPASN